MAVCAAVGCYNKQSAKQLDVSFHRYIFDLYTPRPAHFFRVRTSSFYCASFVGPWWNIFQTFSENCLFRWAVM
jgi:hypothetical protein